MRHPRPVSKSVAHMFLACNVTTTHRVRDERRACGSGTESMLPQPEQQAPVQPALLQRQTLQHQQTTAAAASLAQQTQQPRQSQRQAKQQHFASITKEHLQQVRRHATTSDPFLANPFMANASSRFPPAHL